MKALLLVVVVAMPAAAQHTPKPPRLFGIDGADVRVAEVLSPIAVSTHAINLFSTPTAVCGDKIIVASVEDGPQAPKRLVTVIRVGEKSAGNRWTWKREVLEPRTLPDDWHTQPSIGVDERGHVHVAYNMHNMPWQYAVSRAPCSIDDFAFKGHPVSDVELHTAFELNRSPFFDAGTALIPGNQVTYPAFFNDRNGQLYVTYRFAVRPARPWLDRAFGGGIARFDVVAQTWEPVGGEVPLSTQDATPAPGARSASYPFTWEPGWSVYHPRLWFDRNNAMHVTWTWREKQAGLDTTNPSYAMRRATERDFRRADETRHSLPVRLRDAGVIDALPPSQVYHAGTSVTTDVQGRPLIVLELDKAPRVIVTYEVADRHWRVSEQSPYGAPWVVCEDEGTCFAYASGPTVLRRKARESTWQIIHRETGYCDPKPLHLLQHKRRLLHVTRCDQRAAKVLEITDE